MIQLDCAFEPVTPKSKIEALKCGNDSLLAWWYCGILKNKKDQTQPLVMVAFRKQIAANIFSDEIIYRYLSIVTLGQVRIGSLCRNDKVVEYAKFETFDSELDFGQDGWRFTSFDETTNQNGIAPPFPQEIFPLAYERDKSWLIEFQLPAQGKLLVPSLEYFTRCYGSGELRRILMTYPWDGQGGCLDRFFSPIDEPEVPNVWKVKLNTRLRNGDTIFLAHIKYDRYTEQVAKSIHSSVEVQHSPKGNPLAFVQIGPWFKGRALLQVKGIPFNNGRSFLGLQVTGLSEPSGEDIERRRANRGDALNPAEPGADGNAWSGVAVGYPVRPPEIVNLTADETPDNGSATIEIDDPTLVILGPRRTVRNRRDEQATSSGGPKSAEAAVDTLSAGDPYGGDKDVAQASIKTELVLESEGALRDTWNALLHLKEQYPDTVKTIEWYTPSNGFTQNKNPELIALEPFELNETLDDEPIPEAIRKWLYMDPKTQVEPRGLLVARVDIMGKLVHIIEIQRRPCKRQDENGKKVDAEEAFKGLVFILPSQDLFDKRLDFFRSNVRLVKGVVYKLMKSWPGKVDVFKHTTSKSDNVPCWSGLMNGLKKVDIILKPPKGACKPTDLN